MPPQHVDGSNAPLPKAAPKVTPLSPGEKKRLAMNGWAKWAIANHGQFVYTQTPARWHMVTSPPGSLPQSADCSSFVTALAKWAGASDPNGLAFKAGYTGTLLSHCNHIDREQAQMGDLIVYGPGTGDHAVFVMQRIFGDGGADFWVASHGHAGDPGRRLHSEMLAYFHGVAAYLRWISP